MIDASIVATIIVISWFIFRWVKAGEDIKKGERLRQQALLEIELAKKKEIEEAELRKAEFQKKIEEDIRLKEEKAKKEISRIESLKSKRPTVQEKSLETDCASVSADSKDYIDLDMNINGYEIRAVYLDQDDLDQIESSEDEEDAIREIVIDLGETFPFAQWIHRAEIGTSSEYEVISEQEDTESDNDTTTLFDQIVEILGEPDEDTVAIGFEIIRTKDLHIYGTSGIDFKIEDVLDDVVFHERYIRIGSESVNYSEFCTESLGWNNVYYTKISIEEAKELGSLDEIL
jgi:hypothetical protein